jgi:hypothetical protein
MSISQFRTLLVVSLILGLFAGFFDTVFPSAIPEALSLAQSAQDDDLSTQRMVMLILGGLVILIAYTASFHHITCHDVLADSGG